LFAIQHTFHQDGETELEETAAPRRRGSDTRERIVVVAEELIALHGVEGFQLKDVAARIGIRPPSIFAHFAGREAIAQAVAERMVGGIASLVDEIKDEEPAATLTRWVRNLVAYLSEHPAHVRLILRDMAHVGSPNVASIASAQQSMEQIKTHLDEVLKRGEAEGTFRPVRPDSVIAQVIGAVVSNLAWEGWDEDGNPLPGAPIETIQDETEQLILGYVLKRR
jgi:AcrR family transcriptional regulator